MAECRAQWLDRLREEPSATQTSSSQHNTFATPSEHTCAQAWHTNFAAAPWENAGNPLLAGCSRPRCGSCGILLKTGELECPICPRRASGSDESARSARDEDVAELRRQRRKAQMRLVSLGRGDIKPRPGEPQCLEVLVAELGAVLRQPRGADGKFAARGGAEDAPQPV